MMEAWKFRYTTLGFIWVKLYPKAYLTSCKDEDTISYLNRVACRGPGNYTASNTEPCLLGVKGKMPPKAKLRPSTVFAPRGKYWAKPPVVRERIVEMYGDVPRIELFAREQAPGWDATGLEFDGVDIRTFLKE